MSLVFRKAAFGCALLANPIFINEAQGLTKFMEGKESFSAAQDEKYSGDTEAGNGIAGPIEDTTHGGSKAQVLSKSRESSGPSSLIKGLFKKWGLAMLAMGALNMGHSEYRLAQVQGQLEDIKNAHAARALVGNTPVNLVTKQNLRAQLKDIKQALLSERGKISLRKKIDGLTATAGNLEEKLDVVAGNVEDMKLDGDRVSDKIEEVIADLGEKVDDVDEALSHLANKSDVAALGDLLKAQGLATTEGLSELANKSDVNAVLMLVDDLAEKMHEGDEEIDPDTTTSSTTIIDPDTTTTTSSTTISVRDDGVIPITNISMFPPTEYQYRIIENNTNPEKMEFLRLQNSSLAEAIDFLNRPTTLTFWNSEDKKDASDIVKEVTNMKRDDGTPIPFEEAMENFGDEYSVNEDKREILKVAAVVENAVLRRGWGRSSMGHATKRLGYENDPEYFHATQYLQMLVETLQHAFIDENNALREGVTDMRTLFYAVETLMKLIKDERFMSMCQGKIMREASNRTPSPWSWYYSESPDGVGRDQWMLRWVRENKHLPRGTGFWNIMKERFGGYGWYMKLMDMTEALENIWELAVASGYWSYTRLPILRSLPSELMPVQPRE